MGVGAEKAEGENEGYRESRDEGDSESRTKRKKQKGSKL